MRKRNYFIESVLSASKRISKLLEFVLISLLGYVVQNQLQFQRLGRCEFFWWINFLSFNNVETYFHAKDFFEILLNFDCFSNEQRLLVCLLC